MEPVQSPTLDVLPVSQLRGVGSRLVARLRKLGILTVQDLLFHLPVRYQDRTRVQPIAGLQAGDEAQIEGRVSDVRIGQGARRSLQVWFEDDNGGILLRFFHFGHHQTAVFALDARLRCFGEVRFGPHSLEMVHPEYRSLTEDAAGSLETRLSAVYPSTEGLYQATWRSLADQALALLERDGPLQQELLPAETRQRLGLPGLAQALHLLHRPPPETPMETLGERQHPARRRLILEELVAHQLSLRQLRRQRLCESSPVLAGDGALRARLLASLRFTLTGAQRRVAAEIAADLTASRPMLRLLQGDVGSGKTVIAALAALQAVEAGYQAVLMVPTELLSEQHLRNLSHWLEPLGLEPLWFAGRHKGRDRAQRLARIASGEARMVIGTHALFQRAVTFADLGLAIIDEQHRFGVHQRLQLREKGAGNGGIPHQLIMTATPIPRSLAMVGYADLDLSVLDERPPGRQPIVTVAVSDRRREEVIVRVREACASGRQAYWVCTLIEESEALQCQAAEDTAATLAKALGDRRVGLVHGRLKAAEREAAMRAFALGETDLLVATTVIEVGMDVPNASLMIIENPERLGLAQLHQLRGRVGRGRRESHCVLLYRAPLPALARARIDLLRRSADGFEIAEQDLRMRGPGEVLGTRQTGEIAFRLADPVADEALLEPAQALAEVLLDHHPDKVPRLIARWTRNQTPLGGV